MTAGQVNVNLDVYRTCLKARGSQRESASTTQPPAGHFCGQENEGPVALGTVPPQPR